MSLVTLSRGQLQTLRSQLPLFGTDNAPALAGRFCQFYGIDFAERLPHVGYKVGRVDSGSYSLAVHSWVQPGATNNLFLVHGYFDHTGLFGKLAEWALLRGCNVLSVDLPGHGLSTGEPAVIDDFGDYSRAIADVLVVAAPAQRRSRVVPQRGRGRREPRLQGGEGGIAGCRYEEGELREG